MHDLYSNRTEFATHLLRPYQIRKLCFQLRETPRVGAFEGFGVSFRNCSCVRVGRTIPNSKCNFHYNKVFQFLSSLFHRALNNLKNVGA